MFYFRSVWALVVAQISSAAIEVLASYLAHPHRPRFDFHLKKVLDLLHFSKWVTGTSIIALLVTRGDDMFVSKYLGTTALGFYALAYQLANLPATQITHVLGRVSFPTYSRLQGNPPALRKAFIDVMKATLLVSGPLAVILMLLIEGIVSFVIGQKWAPIVPLVQVLAIAGFVRSVAALGGALFQACGVPDIDFRMNLPRLVLLLGLIWPACAYAGMLGATLVVLISVSACLPTFFVGIRSTVDVRVRDVFKENLLAIVSTSVLAASLWLPKVLVRAESLPAFGFEVVLGFALWFGAMWTIGRVSSVRLFDETARLRQALKR
jgi:O-antigen/teichoic acid export membrane protein